MMKILILGSNGQLGSELMHRALRRTWDIAGVDFPECDITSEESLRHVLKEHGPFEIVINAAAYTAVDRAESEPDAAFAVNRDGAQLLARSCAVHNCALIHISTDYVFDGSGIRPYQPEDPVCPLGVYARSKAEGEAAIRENWGRHIIVRTSWLFGPHGPNFVKTILRLSSEREELRIIDDQVGCPTYAGDLAEALLDAAAQVSNKPGGWGTYHFCNQGAVSWYAFTRRIIALANTYSKFKVKEIAPILTAHYPLPAPRPAYSVLDCTSFEKTFGVVRRPWEAGLKEMLTAVYALNTSPRIKD
jgi:dTDP-4-dehydrorhamnose reductase